MSTDETNSVMNETGKRKRKMDENSEKRSNYLSWEDYFMASAVLAAKRSKDPCRQVGACIVSRDNKIVGIGYNGFPKGCSDDEFPWGKDSDSPEKNKFFYVCHAEMNAILNKNLMDLKDCKLYVTLFPCNECAKVIIQSGITQVFYLSDRKQTKPDVKAAQRMFDAVGITYKQYIPTDKEIVIKLQ